MRLMHFEYSGDRTLRLMVLCNDFLPLLIDIPGDKQTEIVFEFQILRN